jgi:hypothetical protein
MFKLKSPGRRVAAAAALLPAMLFQASNLYAARSEDPPDEEAVAPAVLLNEIQFDSLGVDADSGFGNEWIELYTTEAIDLADIEIVSEDGSISGALPSASIPAFTHVLVILGGLQSYVIDGNPADGTYSLTLGLTQGDLLPNAQTAGDWGGVTLYHQGSKVDSLAWGHGTAPIGVSGPYFDVSYAGGRPINEADSLGRSGSPVADFTGTDADWDRNGGKNAAGSTPKQRNGVYVLDADNALKFAQAGVCDIVNSFAYMTGQNQKYMFDNSGVANVQTQTTANSLTVTADHTFQMTVAGQPTTLTGTLVAGMQKSEVPGAVAYILTLTGTMSSPQGWAFSIDYARGVSGLHTNTQTAYTQTDVVYTENGVDYAYSCTVNKAVGRLSDQVWMMGDTRQGQDYSSPVVKNSIAVSTYTRLSDGVITAHFDMTRDMPIGPRAPGQTGGIDYQQRLVTESQACGDEWGAFSTSITRYDEYKNGQLVASLEPGKSGSSDLFFTGASVHEPLGAAYHLLTLPMLIGGHKVQISEGARGEVEMVAGNYVAKCQVQINANGLMAQRFSIFVDPPLQEGGSGASSKAGEGGFGDAAVNCATKGGAIGAGVGAGVGGIAGGVGGAAVGGVVGTLGGPPGAVAAATAGGAGGAAVGVGIGSAAGAIAGGGVGAAACMIGYTVSAVWNWLWS